MAITHDTVRQPGVNLFAELGHGDDIRVAVMSPQMLSSGEGIASCLKQTAFKTQVRWMLIDEVHLFADETSIFNGPYKALAPMREILPHETQWTAVSGSITPAQALEVGKALGFHPGHYINARYNLDRPNIYYIPRILSHPTSSSTFLDLAFLIPFDATSIQDIPTAIVFADAIRTGQAIMGFLDLLLEIRLPQYAHRKKVVRLYNSIFDEDYCHQLVSDFEDTNSSLRIALVTDTLTYGLDLKVSLVITYDMAVSPQRRKQQIGRSGRQNQPSVAITFAPGWVRDVVINTHSTTQAKEDAARREKLPKPTQEWYNYTPCLCPRASDCAYFGDKMPSDFAQSCRCPIHEPQNDPTPSHLACIDRWANYFETTKHRAKAIRGNAKIYRPLEPAMKRSVELMIGQWKAQTWAKIRGDNIHVTSDFFLPPKIIQTIVDRAHACTTIANFHAIAQTWRYLDTHGTELFGFLTRVMLAFREAFWQEEVPEDSKSLVEDSETETESDPEMESESEAISVVPTGSTSFCAALQSMTFDQNYKEPEVRKRSPEPGLSPEKKRLHKIILNTSVCRKGNHVNA